jgi:hypothetical protein
VTTCFVIGPIGDERAPLGSPGRTIWESSLEIYESVISSACTFLGIEAVRADQISISGDITDQIFRRLYESDIVIADITGANANVMYELGLRHSLDKLTIQVVDEGTALPFDIKAVRTIPINRSQYGLIEARKRLSRAIEDGLEKGPDRVAATRVWEALRTGSSTDLSPFLGDERADKLPTVDDENAEGYLELIQNMSGDFETLTASTEAIGACIITLGEETEAANRDIDSLTSDSSDKLRLTLIRKFANILDLRGREFLSLTDDFDRDIRALDARVTPLLELIAENESLQRMDGVEGYLDSISSLAESSREGMNGLGTFAASVKTLGIMTKVLRAPANLIVSGVAKMTDAAALLDNWDTAAQRIKLLVSHSGTNE